MLIPRISRIIQRPGRLYCLRLYPNIRRKHKNSIIIPNTQPCIMKTLPKKKECHLVNSLRNIFYQSFIWHPFKDGTLKMCYVPTHFSQTSHANIIAHWHFSTNLSTGLCPFTPYPMSGMSTPHPHTCKNSTHSSSICIRIRTWNSWFLCTIVERLNVPQVKLT